MKTLRTASCIALILLSTACGSVKEAMHGARSEPPVLHLTLVPTTPLAVGKPTEIATKLTNINTRALVTARDLSVPNASTLQLYALDTTFTDLQRINTQSSGIEGLYQFNLTPHLPGSYRIWARAPLASAPQASFPFNDVGPRSQGKFNKTEMLQQKKDGLTFTLKTDGPLIRFHENTLAVETTDASGAPVAATLTDMLGVYSDYRTLVQFPTQENTAIFSPDSDGFMKFFATVKANGREFPLTFTTSIAKD